MTENMKHGVWTRHLKPWSDRWCHLCAPFNDDARDRKKAKPRIDALTIRA